MHVKNVKLIALVHRVDVCPKTNLKNVYFLRIHLSHLLKASGVRECRHQSSQ